jgi:hypothetical protein
MKDALLSCVSFDPSACAPQISPRLFVFFRVSNLALRTLCSTWSASYNRKVQDSQGTWEDRLDCGTVGDDDTHSTVNTP